MRFESPNATITEILENNDITRVLGGSDIYSFCKRLDKKLAKPLGLEARPGDPSKVQFSAVLTLSLTPTC